MDRIYPVTLTVPLGTQTFNPVTLAVALENALLVDIDLLIPPGHNGFTGLRIRSSRQQIIPWGNVDWIIASDYTHKFPVNEEIGSKSISITAYNTDVYDHTFYLHFTVTNLAPGRAVSLSSSSAPILTQTETPQGSTSPLDSIGDGGGGLLLPTSLVLPPPPPPPSL